MAKAALSKPFSNPTAIVSDITNDACELGIPPEPINLLKSNFLSHDSTILSACAANQPISAVKSTELAASCCKYDINLSLVFPVYKIICKLL